MLLQFWKVANSTLMDTGKFGRYNCIRVRAKSMAEIMPAETAISALDIVLKAQKPPNNSTIKNMPPLKMAERRGSAETSETPSTPKVFTIKKNLPK